MIEKSTPAGWVIEVLSPNISGQSDAPPKFRYFNVNEPDVERAMKAVGKLCSTDDQVSQAVRPLTTEELQKLGLHKGQARPA